MPITKWRLRWYHAGVRYGTSFHSSEKKAQEAGKIKQGQGYTILIDEVPGNYRD
jgi:hypothetical protein